MTGLSLLSMNAGNRDPKQQDCKTMNHIKSETRRVSVDTTPIYASVWLALFSGLRKNINERRMAAAVANTQNSQPTEKK